MDLRNMTSKGECVEVIKVKEFLEVFLSFLLILLLLGILVNALLAYQYLVMLDQVLIGGP